MDLFGYPLRFLRDERGSVSVEAILIFPILCWAYMGMFVFFDAFRAQSVNIKVAYTLGDILSRQTDYVTPEFMDSMYQLQTTLTDTEQAKKLRVTAFRYTASGNTLNVVWSQSRGGAPAMTNTVLRSMSTRIPAMANNDVAILTETWMGYAPAMDVGIDPFTFSEMVVTRPRFALNSRFCWNPLNDNGTPATEVC